MESKSPQVYLQCHKAAVSLVCRVGLSSGCCSLLLLVAVLWCWVSAHQYGEQISTGVFAVPQGCYQLGLQRTTEQRVLQFARISDAVLWCWVSAHLYGEQISTGVFAVPQGCCQPGLQSSAEQWVLQFARMSAALHWCWVSMESKSPLVYLTAA